MSNASMTAVVEFQIRPENVSMEGWLDIWDKRAQDAWEGEPETTAYAAAVNLEDERNVLVFERYAHGERSIKTHSERPAHAELTRTMGERNVTKRRVLSARFDDIEDYGWWSRPDADGGSGAAGAIITLLGMRFIGEATRAAFIDISARHADYCWREEPETLIYTGGLASADADREIDLKTGDLVFMMVTTDMAATEKHANDPEHLGLGATFEARGVKMEQLFLRSYRTTGNGYLWR